MEKIRDVSQHGEQPIVEAFFNLVPPKNKFLVDVGAFDTNFSNTWALLNNGWAGLLIEPNPQCAAKLRNQFSALQAEVLECAVSDKRDVADLYLHSGYGHDSLLFSWYPQDRTKATVKVETYPLAEILASKNVPPDFDFLSIDTEGYDKIILNALFYSSTFRPRLLIVERTSFIGDEAFFTRRGYSLLKRTGPPDYGNYIFAKGDDLPLGVFKL